MGGSEGCVDGMAPRLLRGRRLGTKIWGRDLGTGEVAATEGAPSSMSYRTYTIRTFVSCSSSGTLHRQMDMPAIHNYDTPSVPQPRRVASPPGRTAGNTDVRLTQTDAVRLESTAPEPSRARRGDLPATKRRPCDTPSMHQRRSCLSLIRRHAWSKDMDAGGLCDVSIGGTR